MLGRGYEDQNCSAARALEVVGERWSILILRDALFRGITQFSDFQRSLGIATNVLAKRLDGFVSEGLLEKSDGDGTYRPTERALDFKPVIMALTAWGDRWATPGGPPVTFRHQGCGGEVRLALACSACGTEPTLSDTLAVPNVARQ